MNSPCIADDNGRPCPHGPDVLRPVPLCKRHRIEVALTVVRGLLCDALETALTSNATGVATRGSVAGTRGATPVARHPASTSQPKRDEADEQVDRLVLLLRCQASLTKDVVAKLLDVSPATAGRRLRRARARIEVERQNR
ncbi:hypothetical protein DIZ27_38910 [Streptomyces sp. NWU339]|uniref:hypothetical protein n=1 Tax=Streptomyces sp. NWU339 TaxID=2185284 RepID=UPI000D6758D9|nr:hypothetical protein [Streptomyces sp. NWU339]PWI05506.1 hypothetical protein DIZ27_38910 [Streptomyces sp. NWU339]